MSEVFDDALHEYHKNRDKVNTCIECGTPCEKEFCSITCYKTNQI